MTALRLITFVILAIALYGLAVWVLWRPVLEPVWNGASLQSTIKNWYLGDQLTWRPAAGASGGRERPWPRAPRAPTDAAGATRAAG